MEFIDLKSQYQRLQDNIHSAMNRVFEHGVFINGPEVNELENKLCEYTSAKHCIAVANGTDALEIAEKALNIKAGDEVIIPSYTWVSTAETVKYLGATPIYSDINEDTFNIDINDVQNKITSQTKAIVAVSLFGQCADLQDLKTLCDDNQIFLIEDAAQSFGAKHFNNKSCNIAHVSTTSFFPSKPLGCYGDGGAIFTNNEDLAIKMRLLARHGQVTRDTFKLVGRNSRLDTLQAAILIEKLKIFDEEIVRRNKIHELYISNINPEIATAPMIKPENLSVFAQYTLKVKSKERKSIINNFERLKIPHICYYQSPLFKQEAYKSNIDQLNVTERLANNTVSIPMSPYLSDDQVLFICEAINNI